MASLNPLSTCRTFHGFLSLPIEIRLNIYELAVDMEPERPRRFRSSLNYNISFSSLPRVSHLVRKECLAINYRRHRFPLLKEWVTLLHNDPTLRHRHVLPHSRIRSVPDHLLRHLWLFQLEVNCVDDTRNLICTLAIRRTRGKWGLEITKSWNSYGIPGPLCKYWLKQVTRPETGLTALMDRIQIVLDECPEGPITRDWMIRLAQTAGGSNSISE